MRAVFLLFVSLCAGMLVQNAGAASLVDGPTVELTSPTSATLRWSTDVATGARVRYGTTSSLLDQGAQGQVGSQHAVVLSGLRPATRYYYTIGTARVPLATNSFSTPPRPGTAVKSPEAKAGAPGREVKTAPATAPPTRDTWGAPASLRDHFERHGGDFKARDPDDYARLAWEFRQRARVEQLPTKVDEDGVVRIFDPKSGAFAAYNRDGTTKTYFKPESRGYFDRQPGKSINPKTLTW